MPPAAEINKFFTVGEKVEVECFTVQCRLIIQLQSLDHRHRHRHTKNCAAALLSGTKLDIMWGVMLNPSQFKGNTGGGPLSMHMT